MSLGAIGEDDEKVRENERMKEFERIRESGSEEKKEEREGFVERKKKKSYGEYEEITGMKRMKKKNKRLVIIGKNEKARTDLIG